MSETYHLMIEVARLLEDARAAGYSIQDCGGFVTVISPPNGRSGLLLYPDNTAFQINVASLQSQSSGRPDVNVAPLQSCRTVNQGTRDVSEMRRILGLPPRAEEKHKP